MEVLKNTKQDLLQKVLVNVKVLITLTFARVVKYVTRLILLALATFFGWPVDQLDVVTAFLYGLMKELVFIRVPEGMNIGEIFDCLELLKAIYRLKQACRVWNETFDVYACSIVFKVSKYDPCLYRKVHVYTGKCK